MPRMFGMISGLTDQVGDGTCDQDYSSRDITIERSSMGIGKVISVLDKTNLKCQVKVLPRLLDVSLKFRGGLETNRIYVSIYNEQWEETLSPQPYFFYLGCR